MVRIKEIDQATFSPSEQYGEGLYEWMLASGLSIVAVNDEGLTVGWAFVQMNPYTHVRSLAVHPSFQRRGYGSALLRAVIANANREVDLLVDEANECAMRLYRRFGFQPAEMCPTAPPKRRMVLKIEATGS